MYLHAYIASGGSECIAESALTLRLYDATFFSSSVNIQPLVCTFYCWSGMGQWWLLV